MNFSWSTIFAQVTRIVRPWDQIGGLMLKTPRAYYLARARYAVASARFLQRAAQWATTWPQDHYDEAERLRAMAREHVEACRAWRRLAHGQGIS